MITDDDIIISNVHGAAFCVSIGEEGTLVTGKSQATLKFGDLRNAFLSVWIDDKSDDGKQHDDGKGPLKRDALWIPLLRVDGETGGEEWELVK